MTEAELTLDSAKERVLELSHQYDRLRMAGMDRGYNEARTVNEFILPLFEALGWDIHNRGAQDEVLPEQPAAAGRADWAFSIRGITRFLVEAKSLSSNLANPQYARQAINYSYSRGVTWAVLTNFSEFRLYNAEWALPDPDLSRFLAFRWDQLVPEFDRLWLLSRPAIEAGLLDAEAERYGKKRTKTPVGEQLFSDLVIFRQELRKVFIAYNPSVGQDVIDHAVQRLLDRLIFIRAAEDRGIEPPQLRPLLRTLEQSNKRGSLWDRLRVLFRDWDKRYNSQLFAEQALDRLETEWQPVWETVLGLHETDRGLIQYDFRGIDADVLGGVYEQYLGHLAKVEVQTPDRRRAEKRPTKKDVTRPIRKAHGVYYTPKWLVRYIVAGAVRPLLERYTPDQVRGMRIIDPACGSGSFLVEAFKVLTQYWTRREEPATATEALDLRLRILKDNLFGIDLDAQAVEIAELNLLLAALNQPTLLPDLSGNFTVANSLFDDSSRPVPHEFEHGGWLKPMEGPSPNGRYDVVVMNPPYYDLQPHPYQRAILRDVYPEVASGHDDVLYYFLARAVDLLREGGQLGCVVARYWLDSHYAEKLRNLLSTKTDLREVIDFRSYQPFGRDVGVNAAIVLAEAGRPSGSLRILAPTTDGFGQVPQVLIEAISSLAPGPPEFQETRIKPTAAPWRTTVTGARSSAETVRLGDIAHLTQGVKAGRNDIYVVSSTTAKERRLEAEPLRPVVEGEDIGVYAVRNTGRKLIYLDGSRPISDFPNIAVFLEEHRAELTGRAEVSRGAYPWWRLQRPRTSPVLDATVRLIGPQLATDPRFSAIASPGELAGAVGLTDTLMLSLVDDSLSPYFVLAVLNSSYGINWTRQHAKVKRGGYREFVATTMAEFPLPLLDRTSQDVIAEYARQLQVIVGDSEGRRRKGRFDEALNATEPRANLIKEINLLLGFG